MTEEYEGPDEDGPQSVKGLAIKKGLVIVNTGDGKGKTTAALGVLFRAWGRGMKVRMFQFIKNTGSHYGEQRAAEKVGIPILALGDGFTWLSKDLEQSGSLAAQQWDNCKEALLSGEDDLIVLDEMTYALQYGWVSTEEVIETLKQRPPMLHVIITGRGAPQELIDYADLVTEMREVKHPYKEQGIKAQAGIEF
jgi:cob(I)alamin adenosyltransferase